MMKIVYMGTPDFAVSALEAIVKAGHEVSLVVTQPDKAQKRSSALVMPPVKEKALEYNIPVFQPEKLRKSDIMDRLNAIKPDVIVVVAFGQILPKDVLEAPKYGCVNIHASLLPKYRGAAPIQWAVINGDEKTGVATMLMDETLDTGDILMLEEYTLRPDETGGSLFDRLAAIGAELIIKTLDGLEKGTIVPKTQEGEASYAAKLDKSMARLDYDRPAKMVECMVRGLNPWPCAYSILGGKTLKIWGAKVCNEAPDDAKVGEIYMIDKEYIYVKCAEGAIAITELQLEGKKRMDTKSFLLGYHIEKGTILE